MRADVGGNEHEARADPGERVRPHDALEAEQVPEQERRDDAHDELDDARDGGNDRRSEALQRSAQDEQGRERPVPEAVDVEHERRELDDALRAVADEQAHHGSAERDEERSEHDSGAERHPHRLDDTAADAVWPAPAEVLRRVHGCREAQRLQERHREAVDARRRRVRGDRIGAERVESDLHRERADADDGCLESHREAEPQVLGDVGARHAPVEAAHVQHRHPPPHVVEAQHDRHRLRDDGREGGTGDSPRQRADHEDHESRVEQARDRQEDERGPRVADRADDRREEVERDDGARAEETDLREHRRPRQELCGGLQQCEDRSREHRREDGQHDRDRRRQQSARGDRAAHTREVARTERLRRRNREPAREAAGEPEQQEQQRSRRPDGGERVDAEETPDDDGIDELVQLLDDVADQQRHREGEDDAPRAAGGEGAGHGSFAGGSGER